MILYVFIVTVPVTIPLKGDTKEGRNIKVLNVGPEIR